MYRFPELIVKFFVIAIFLVTSTRLFYLQIASQEQLSKISRKNILRSIPIQPMRGRFYGKENEILLDNQPLYSVTVVPAEFKKKSIPQLAEILEITPEYITKTINEAISVNRFTPVTIKRDISFSVLAKTSEQLWKIPSIQLEVQTKRNYRSIKPVHAFGYTNIISKEMLKKFKEETYSQNDIVGHSGIEYQYERFLKGKKGVRFVVVNSVGKVISEFARGNNNIEPKKGYSLRLSIDAELQKLSEKILDSMGVSGSIIAMHPQTGEILVIANSPTYDPEDLEGLIDKKIWKKLAADRKKPLFNRSIQGLYPPASTYKMVSAIAALEENIITPSWTVFCKGYFRYGNKIFRCHRRSGHGYVNVEKAIQYSCNVFFYQLILKIGFKRWTKYGRILGFGKKTGIDLPQEKTAPVPSINYYNKIYGVGKWTNGYLISLAIGQGEIIATPIQVLNYISAIANNGVIRRPHIVKGVIDEKGQVEKTFEFEKKNLNISSKTLAIVKRGMLKGVEEGTSRATFIKGSKIAGKTGTAQNPHGQDHVWFTGFMPFENPEISIVIFLENVGRSGGAVAAPIAKKIFKKYLSLKNPGASQDNSHYSNQFN